MSRERRQKRYGKSVNIRPEGMDLNQILDREALIKANIEKLKQLLDKAKESGLENPVALVIDSTGNMGRNIYKAVMVKVNGWTTEKAEQTIADGIRYWRQENKYPTLLYVVSVKQAAELLPLTSPTAEFNLDLCRMMAEANKTIPIVGIGQTGNSYRMLSEF